MDGVLPLRLIGRNDDDSLFIFETKSRRVDDFDILSHKWPPTLDKPGYHYPMPGLHYNVLVPSATIEEIKTLMAQAKINYLWADCLCINQLDDNEILNEVSKMFEYYKGARRCHVLLHMQDAWDPQTIVDDLKFLGHVLSNMGGATLASEAVGLSDNMIRRLAVWENKEEQNWVFPMDKGLVRSSGVDMGVLNCYATCINRITSLFNNIYFKRVWTFQEMILGKNVNLWAINTVALPGTSSATGDYSITLTSIGELPVWMNLATDSNDKANKLYQWIHCSRDQKSDLVLAILNAIEEQAVEVKSLQLRVGGITSAKSDIMHGGSSWWKFNSRGVSNIFSAVSLIPRVAEKPRDIYLGLLGIFNGLFDVEQLSTLGMDMDKITFEFFQQLSIKTEFAWTKLAISSGERKQWDWIPVARIPKTPNTTDCFSGVIQLGRLKKKGQAKSMAVTGVKGTPRPYMKIRLVGQESGKFQFIFKGCNCGKKIKTGFFKKETIPTHDTPVQIRTDQTGRTLVWCATVLGSLIDPGCNLPDYRRKLLNRLLPVWRVTDPLAKPIGWTDRCVSGTAWENPGEIRPHNWSMNYDMVDIHHCRSRLHNDSTANLACEVTVNCGCTITAPFSFIFEGISAVKGSSLGETVATLDNDGRITLHDGLGFVQVGDEGKTFKLVAFGGDVRAHRAHAVECRVKKKSKPLELTKPWPSGRALVRDDFTHDMTDMMRNYGYISTEGAGNMLISRNKPVGPYKIIGVCIDQHLSEQEDGYTDVTLR
ncbi:hypothetical protein S40285_07801 [Stachybotrys chlorohalonatus IBT 40285]|uniref:Heterokaryon incompatibility domain-containing protein n=1 Tax=Stachybotrys chlorohalonatus (strain IBT 40285) TaxID=1283841 RepID=A0A084R2F3_STAC4|nr:hypothetical protein S40285_07801 [Stachybotrys chlorohalonata IBT 40285]